MSCEHVQRSTQKKKKKKKKVGMSAVGYKQNVKENAICVVHRDAVEHFEAVH